MSLIDLHPVDLAVVAGYLALTFGVGLYFSRRASRSTEEFFVAGRSLPWWLLGTSMVATTFAADTPLAVAGLTAKGGIFNNWIWFYCGISGVIGAFLFAGLWNRTGVTTDAQFVELRYGGPAAAALRGYKAVWFGLFQNVLIIAWVMRAMAKILVTVMGWNAEATILGLHAEVAVVLILFVLTVAYTILSGLWGVVVTDVMQFVVAMAGSIFLAAIAWMRIGGLDGLKERIGAHAPGVPPVDQLFRIIPEPASLSGFTPFSDFLVIVLVIWWADSNVDGRGYIAQRLLAARDDRHAKLAYLWYIIAHICFRPWPWIVAGLCGIAFFGPVADPETYYPRVMAAVLPVGFFGILLAAFLAAFMSTIDTQLNWGSSLLVTDLYKRFLRPAAPDRECLRAARAFTAALALAGAGASFLVRDISTAWMLVVSVTAGVGSVYIARWYWWRVNAWSEFAAFITALVMTMAFKHLAGGGSPLPPEWRASPLLQFPYSAAITALISIPIWVSVTLLTAPTSDERLLGFYEKVRPGGPGWTRISSRVPGAENDGPGGGTFVNIVLGLTGVYALLIGPGRFILGKPVSGAIITAAGLAAILILSWRVKPSSTRPLTPPRTRPRPPRSRPSCASRA